MKVVGGGGGTILPTEIEELHAAGIDRIYAPDDGRKLGLQGMINDVLERADFPRGENFDWTSTKWREGDRHQLAGALSALDNYGLNGTQLPEVTDPPPILGITGTGGAGKSSLTDELLRRLLRDFPELQIAIVSVDPTRRKSGGALLGDRIRLNALHPDISDGRVYMRSLATRATNRALSDSIPDTLKVLQAAGFGLILLETSGIGQSGTEVTDFADLSLYVMTPEFGAATQLEKIDMLDFADLVALNKADRRGAADALRAVRKQVQRNQNRWDEPLENMPVYPTRASYFGDEGMDRLYTAIVEQLELAGGRPAEVSVGAAAETSIVPPARVRYLSEVTETVRRYHGLSDKQADLASRANALTRSAEEMEAEEVQHALTSRAEELREELRPEIRRELDGWPELADRYRADEFVYQVRKRDIRVPTTATTLSHTKVPRLALPRYTDPGDLLRWLRAEHLPGYFPFTAGVFPFKRRGEAPARMFAGEGGPERTNRRFHYLALGQPATRLSTAFDSVTLYGEDPDERLDIYGKVGNSGVSVATLDDCKRLYSGFDLCDPSTSVSMTINGPAATVCSLFLQTAIDQQCERYLQEHDLSERVEDFLKNRFDERGLDRPAYRGKLPEGHDGSGLLLLGMTGDEVLDAEVYEQLRKKALTTVRGTVQADILKEDQAQNTCIFSTEFSLRLMGDMQQYFIDEGIRNFYSVSISGYHIAEAGANPITQLAFTLANGFTYVEYYLSRGMAIDDFAPNLSFFFSNGVDAEYAVIGRVARRIWAIAMRDKYGADERSQKLKYHIQTSGRSLHAQEISFNDIRTTLQALYAIYDNCNSLHTNAYDEAITTPTEESVRRALAIQLIINEELGLAKNENPLQGSFIIEELTQLVEEAVLLEFDRLTERGGVLGAMETMYQRTQIQEESMHYEMLKHTGELPVIGVNTFLSDEGSPTVIPDEVIRSTTEEKDAQIEGLRAYRKAHAPEEAKAALESLAETAAAGGNTFSELLEAIRTNTLGDITRSLYRVGGQYRRNM